MFYREEQEIMTNQVLDKVRYIRDSAPTDRQIANAVVDVLIGADVDLRHLSLAQMKDLLTKAVRFSNRHSKQVKP